MKHTQSVNKSNGKLQYKPTSALQTDRHAMPLAQARRAICIMVIFIHHNNGSSKKRI